MSLLRNVSRYGAFFTFASLFASAAYAAIPVATGCNACTLAQVQAKAIANYKSTIPAIGGQAQQYVYDISGNSIYAFFVDSEPAENGRPAYTITRTLTVPANMSSLFGKYRAAVVANAGSQTFNETIAINIPSPLSTNPDGSYHDNGSINTYDILTISAANYAVVQCLSTYTCNFSFTNSSPTVDSAFVAFLQQFKSDIINFDGLSSIYSIVFPDGSSVTYKYNAATNTWEVVPGSAYDSHHNLLNPLPKPPHQFLNNGGNTYDGRNIGHLINTIFPGDPYCAYLDWDGHTLTCFEVP